jgi:excisionase family DNA binding protein
MTDDFPQVLTIEETSKYRCVPLSSLYKLAQDAKISCQKVGRHWRFRKATLDEWLDARVSVTHLPTSDLINKPKRMMVYRNEPEGVAWMFSTCVIR